MLVLIYIGIPTILIIMQPDYGTAMVFLVVAALMIFISGINIGYIIGAIVTIVVGIFVAYNYVLPDYAKTRITVFLNPEMDPSGAGYNIIQSQLAVGSGQMWGMGLFNGNQTQLGYLPMKTTDFIYAVISEEMGFIVSSLIVILFVFLIAKSIHIGKTAKDTYGSLISIGVSRNVFSTLFRKCRNEYRINANYRNSTSIYKLWWKCNAYKFRRFRTSFKYKRKAK